MLTVYKDIDMIFRALKAGACGYVLKRSDEQEIWTRSLKSGRGEPP